jgi:hypothetical protein
MIGLVAGNLRSANAADFTFGATTNVGPKVNTSYNDGTPCISRDGLSLYFGSTRPGGVGAHDLWVATRTSTVDEWSEPVHLGTAVNSWAQDYGPSISGDELTLYFRSNRSGGLGQGDIWVSTRSSKDATWPSAVNAGPGINTSSDECMPCISADGLELYFGSRRGGYGADDIYVVTRPTTGSDWSDPVNLGAAVNSAAVDACPSIAPDGLTLFFNSTRSGGFGNYDLYVTTRPSKEAHWSTAVNLGETINTADDEMTPSFWADGAVMYFCSWAEDRPGALGGSDLWQASITPMADFNCDEKVDFRDFSLLAEYWHQDESPFANGRTDCEDVAVFADNWLKEVLPASLVAYWKLDETEGYTAHDSAGDYDAFVLAAHPLWRPTDGVVNGALELDGIDDCVSVPFILDPVDGPFSVFAWVKDGVPGQVIMSQIGAANWLATDPSEGKLMTGLSRPAGGRFPPEPLTSECLITDGLWHRIGLTWNGSDRTLYVDDVEVAKDTQPSLAGSDRGLYFGAGKDRDPGSFFLGLVDDVRIYNQALTLEQIEQLAR